jgi:hypothetical protein
MSASRIILFYARLSFVIKMKCSANTGNSKSHRLGGWVAAHARRVLVSCAVAILSGAYELPQVSILSMVVSRSRPCPGLR